MIYSFKHDGPFSETTQGLRDHSSSRPSGYVGYSIMNRGISRTHTHFINIYIQTYTYEYMHIIYIYTNIYICIYAYIYKHIYI